MCDVKHVNTNTKFMLFCYKMCLVVIYTLLRGEKIIQKFRKWRKNVKNKVYWRGEIHTLYFWLNWIYFKTGLLFSLNASSYFLMPKTDLGGSVPYKCHDYEWSPPLGWLDSINKEILWQVFTKFYMKGENFIFETKVKQCVTQQLLEKLLGEIKNFI